MQLETVNKLFLELSQVSTAITAREIRLLYLLRDAKEELIHSNNYYTNSEKKAIIEKIKEATQDI